MNRHSVLLVLEGAIYAILVQLIDQVVNLCFESLDALRVLVTEPIGGGRDEILHIVKIAKASMVDATVLWVRCVVLHLELNVFLPVSSV